VLLTQNWTLTFYLHDAVYLYLLTVNQTLAEGNWDYRDGHLLRNKTIGQRFTGERLAIKTRKLSYRKDDRAMRPIYVCPEHFRESLSTSTATFADIFNGT